MEWTIRRERQGLRANNNLLANSAGSSIVFSAVGLILNNETGGGAVAFCRGLAASRGITESGNRGIATRWRRGISRG